VTHGNRTADGVAGVEHRQAFRGDVGGDAKRWYCVGNDNAVERRSAKQFSCAIDEQPISGRRKGLRGASRSARAGGPYQRGVPC